MLTMKIIELLHEETQKEYVGRLVKTLNIQKLGKGVFAQVFQHPVYHNVAVKVVKDDPNYLRFAKFCATHPNNPWLPKIVSIHKVKVDDDMYDRASYRRHDRASTDNLHIVFFQKLRKATTSEIKLAVRQVLSDLPDAADYHYRSFVAFDSDLWRDVAANTKDAHLRLVARFFSTLGRTDLHDANVMMRDEGDHSQLVFTDPIAS